MDEILIIIAGMSFVILRVFQWARKMMVELSEDTQNLQDEVADLNKRNLQLEAKLEYCNERRKRANKAAHHYKERYLEQTIENKTLMGKL